MVNNLIKLLSMASISYKRKNIFVLEPSKNFDFENEAECLACCNCLWYVELKFIEKNNRNWVFFFSFRQPIWRRHTVLRCSSWHATFDFYKIKPRNARSGFSWRFGFDSSKSIWQNKTFENFDSWMGWWWHNWWESSFVRNIWVLNVAS